MLKYFSCIKYFFQEGAKIFCGFKDLDMRILNENRLQRVFYLKLKSKTSHASWNTPFYDRSQRRHGWILGHRLGSDWNAHLKYHINFLMDSTGPHHTNNGCPVWLLCSFPTTQGCLRAEVTPWDTSLLSRRCSQSFTEELWSFFSMNLGFPLEITESFQVQLIVTG